MIDVLVPVLGRPQNIQPFLDTFKAYAPAGTTLTFLASAQDPLYNKVSVDIEHQWLEMPFRASRGDYARKMNAGFEATSQKWVFLAADDIRFTPGWADRLPDDADVIATNDHANRQVMDGLFGTHCFVRRRYVTEHGGSADGPGVLLHEGYDHNFVDRELCGLARARGRFHYAADRIVPHLHFLTGKASRDRTYQKGLRHFRQDRELFLKRAHLWEWEGLTSPERTLSQRRYGDIVRA